MAIDPATAVQIASALQSIKDDAIKFFKGIRGKTRHISWEQSNAITQPIANKFAELISGYTVGAFDWQGFSQDAAYLIRNCNWWKKGNDVMPNIARDIDANPSLVGTIWRVLTWGFMNAPSDNFKDAYYATHEIFNSCLYNRLNALQQNTLVIGMDEVIAATGGVSPQYGGLQGGGSSSPIILDGKITKAGYNLLGGLAVASVALVLLFKMKK